MGQITIAGIDIGRSSISVCILSEIPQDLKRFRQQFKKMEFKPNRAGITAFLALQFDAALMEPTGGHYSKIWEFHLLQNNREVRYVGHQEIASYRESWKIFNKSDKLDAIALACYGLERWERPQFFIKGTSSKLRELTLQLESFNRIKNPILNRLRQQLAHECPELSKKSIDREWLQLQPSGVLKSLVGNASTHWQELLNQSIGTGISSFSQGLAAQLILLEQQELELEQKIEAELQLPQYQPYLKILEQYAIGRRTGAALLGVIYPFEKFLDHNGKPIVERVNGRKYYRSLSSFKLALGLGTVQYQSGGIDLKKAGGRSDIRTALWRWCKISIVMKPNLKLPAIQQLRTYYKEGTDAIVNGKLEHLDPGKGDQRMMRVVRRMLTMLFRDLTKISL